MGLSYHTACVAIRSCLLLFSCFLAAFILGGLLAFLLLFLGLFSLLASLRLHHDNLLLYHDHSTFFSGLLF
jgi:hypothetical protein